MPEAAAFSGRGQYTGHHADGLSLTMGQETRVVELGVMRQPPGLVHWKRALAKGAARNMEIGDKTKILKPADVTIKTLDGSLVEGKVNLGFENRMSDLFTKTDDPFIVVFDATHVGSPKKKVLVVNKQHIVWAEPRE